MASKSKQDKNKDKQSRASEGALRYKDRLKGRINDTLNNRDRQKRLVDEATEKFKKNKARFTQDTLTYLKLMISLVRDFWGGRYRKVTKETIGLIVFALLYFLLPLDFIPDPILSAGLIDDVMVIGWVVKRIRGELDAYKEWQEKEQ